MEEQKNPKTPKVGPKSFLSVGPTLHYSHQNVQICWIASMAVYCLSCVFWSKILTGAFFSFSPETFTGIEFLRIGRFVTAPVSIFEYPWQIMVLGLLMAVIAVTPVLVSQLMSFKHSLGYILATIFLGNMPGFAAVILISAFAAATRPLRFRSRFISITLCIAPQMIYWGIFGSSQQVGPIKWGFSFLPWICAWFISIAIAGFVLGVGHFTRYRPGLVWSSTALILILAIGTFGFEIGFDELDYNLYVANNDPKAAVEFHDHSVKEALDDTVSNKNIKEYLAGFFYSTDDPIALRIELKNKILQQLQFGRWPSWLKVPDELKFEDKINQLDSQYDIFIAKRPDSPRMPIALYYKAMLNEFRPDVRVYESKEVLHFYSDYPFEDTTQLWYQLYSDFGDSGESIEARWRIAMQWAGAEMFKLARDTINQAIEMSGRVLSNEKKSGFKKENLLGIFSSSRDSALTSFDIEQLRNRLMTLRELISDENLGKTKESSKQLAAFVRLNRHDLKYAEQLDALLATIGKSNRLYDNIILEKARLIPDELLRAKTFEKIHSDFADTDGGLQALYDLALLRINLWRQTEEDNLERKKDLLIKARQTLSEFVKLYPENFRTAQAREMLSKLPGAD